LNPDHIQRVVVLGAALVLLSLLELRWPLRQVTQSKGRRFLINLGMAATAALVLRMSLYPLVIKISYVTENSGWGAIPRLGLPWPLQLMVSLLALDYTLYLWHRLLHKLPFLWRFHNVHHIDLDMDASTALRFHFGELILSAFYRSAQVILFGIDFWTLLLFETSVTAFALFHHSNLRLPQRLESRWNRLLVTPRMHGVHHSIVQNETDSNFGTILTLWDRLHRTLRLHIPQERITIGVPSYRDPQEQTFLKSLLIPFQRQRKWALPDGTVPVRNGESGMSTKKG
jgi:sterol desaturase/sphingolipid hydroxylase (fatty acid hydroxylase superfamily)